jgi:hypothetical protein
VKHTPFGEDARNRKEGTRRQTPRLLGAGEAGATSVQPGTILLLHLLRVNGVLLGDAICRKEQRGGQSAPYVSSQPDGQAFPAAWAHVCC